MCIIQMGCSEFDYPLMNDLPSEIFKPNNFYSRYSIQKPKACFTSVHSYGSLSALGPTLQLKGGDYSNKITIPSNSISNADTLKMSHLVNSASILSSPPISKERFTSGNTLSKEWKR